MYIGADLLSDDPAAVHTGRLLGRAGVQVLQAGREHQGKTMRERESQVY